MEEGGNTTSILMRNICFTQRAGTDGNKTRKDSRSLGQALKEKMKWKESLKA